MFATEPGYEALLAFATSIGIGLLIGLERERQSDLKAGLRTFALVGLLGCLCALLAQATDSGWILAAGLLAITTTVLLYFKAQLHGISRSLTHVDLLSILQFGVLARVILPILPDRDFGPYQALNPHNIWWMVVLISGVSLAGYAALRLTGARHDAALIGLFGGVASSTHDLRPSCARQCRPDEYRDRGESACQYCCHGAS